MKAKDLIKILEEVPEFDVIVNLTNKTDEGLGVEYVKFNITEYNDTGYSDKVIIFDIEKRI